MSTPRTGLMTNVTGGGRGPTSAGVPTWNADWPRDLELWIEVSIDQEAGMDRA